MPKIVWRQRWCNGINVTNIYQSILFLRYNISYTYHLAICFIFNETETKYSFAITSEWITLTAFITAGIARFVHHQFLSFAPWLIIWIFLLLLILVCWCCNMFVFFNFDYLATWDNFSRCCLSLSASKVTFYTVGKFFQYFLQWKFIVIFFWYWIVFLSLDRFGTKLIPSILFPNYSIYKVWQTMPLDFYKFILVSERTVYSVDDQAFLGWAHGDMKNKLEKSVYVRLNVEKVGGLLFGSCHDSFFTIGFQSILPIKYKWFNIHSLAPS